MSTITLNIEGMTCGHCQKAVIEALQGVQGVEQVEVDLESGKAVVQGSADAQQLVAAVEDEGYDAAVV